VRARPPAVPVHAGTLDVDIVIDLQILADVDAYRTLEENLRHMGFERGENDQGQKVSWRWKTRVEGGAVVILEPGRGRSQDSARFPPQRVLSTEQYLAVRGLRSVLQDSAAELTASREKPTRE
jgi:hypothetical protein